MKIIIACILVGLIRADDGFHIGRTVKTGSGMITGRASPRFNEVSEYLGVPFAKPPVGQLRWAPPEILKNSSNSIMATKLGPSCIQATPYGNFADEDGAESKTAASKEMDEDCLTLNIWTKPQTGERKKAVMIWIYGGSFSMGSASQKGYNGALLADQHDIIVVGVNYRLGVLGYPGVSVPEKNPGLLDQRAAVEWLRDNVESFGGDPGRMILFGQSAGSEQPLWKSGSLSNCG
jgi:cholinesterase